MITIFATGKTKTNFISDGMKEYEKRINKYGKLKWVILPDVKLSSSNNINIVKEKEAQIILNAMKNEKNYTILLDERGKNFSSEELALFLDKKNFNVSFIIGGVYGVSPVVRSSVDMILSFSKFTFTHQMIRLLLIEQIYRCYTIINGKKYHY